MSATATALTPLPRLDDDEDEGAEDDMADYDDEFYSLACAAVDRLDQARRVATVDTPASTSSAKRAPPPRSSGANTKKTRSRVHVHSSAGCATEEVDHVRAFVEFAQTRPQCVGLTWLKGRECDCSTPPGFEMEPTLRAVLERCGTSTLYKHQNEAIKAARAGRSVVVATPTASGKSMCYVVPIFEEIMRDTKSKSKALLMFPLKALANDQFKKMQRYVLAAQELKREVEAASSSPNMEDYRGVVDLKKLERLANVKIAVCDGDTADSVKADIKRHGTQIILTNPDSLHHAMLPGHKAWGKRFWGCLKYIVIDEAHTHTGVAGSHVANVIRRLLRVCSSWDASNRPEFICTSATISNPEDHIRRLTTRVPVCIHESGAPSGDKAMILWQPPEADGAASSSHGPAVDDGNHGLTQRQRRSAYAEAADIIVNLVQRGIRCLAFVSARKIAETVARDAKSILCKMDRGDLAKQVDSYRAGYSQSERRALEARLQRGDIRALVCTSALEMGIDVGSLDATIHVGVPETASSMWQQAGRAGRRRGASVAIVVAAERPLDHYYVSKASELFGRRPEEALVDPFNASILEIHLPCAAKELPLDLRGVDSLLFTAPVDANTTTTKAVPSNFKASLHLAVKRTLQKRKDGVRSCVFNGAAKTIECAPGNFPHRNVMLRGVQSGDPWKLMTLDGGEIIEEVEGHRALARLYVGCLHLSRLGQFMVRRLDHDARVAYAAPYERLEMTAGRERTDVSVVPPDPSEGVEDIQSKTAKSVRVHLGCVHVLEKMLGFQRTDYYSGKVVHEELWRAPVVAAEYRTRAVWFDLPDEVVHRRVAQDALREMTVGVANVCAGLIGSIAMCDTRDVAPAVVFPNLVDGDTNVRVYLYDTTPNGIGISEKVFTRVEDLWEKALELVEACQCESGCPSCTQAGRRGREAGFRKKETKIAFEGLLGRWMM